MEACNAVEREVDKVLSKFGGINDHAHRVLRDMASTVDGLRKEFEEGKNKGIILVKTPGVFWNHTNILNMLFQDQ